MRDQRTRRNEWEAKDQENHGSSWMSQTISEAFGLYSR